MVKSKDTVSVDLQGQLDLTKNGIDAVENNEAEVWAVRALYRVEQRRISPRY